MTNKLNLPKVINDLALRKQLAYENHYWFFHTYLTKYVRFKTADFQREIFAITENEKIKKSVIVAFRGSAKSTIMTLSYPIWAMIGKHQKKFIVIISSTQKQSQLILENLRKELETNSLLTNDFGPFYSQKNEWKNDSIVVKKFNTRITATSTNESIRGIRHRHTRPDLIILDDVEDIDSVKTKAGRDKIWKWFNGEISPLGDQKTKICVIGNMLHDDSLIMRLKESIQNTQRKDYIFKEFPLLDAKKKCIWPGKFRSKSDIKQVKDSVDHISWKREYLLKIVPEYDAVVQKEWIKYYDELPVDSANIHFKCYVTSVDLAISIKSSADYTAMVSGWLYSEEDRKKLYIEPFPFNKRVNFPEVLEEIRRQQKELNTSNITRRLFIENTSYQRSVSEQLHEYGITSEEVSVKGVDKRSRLAQISALIKTGKVLFPKRGVDDLLDQICNFGVEKHDDLADAFSMLLLQLMNELTTKPTPSFELINNLYETTAGNHV